MTTHPILTIADATAFLLTGAPRGGRAHYQLASDLLSAWTGRSIVVSQRPSGRPKLDAPHVELGVSLSYRDGALLIGHSPTRAVGADIEPDDDSLDALRLARDHFTSGEARVIEAERDNGARRDLFLRLWVAKEAILKATGRGVYDGLDEPDFTTTIAALRDNARPFAFAASKRVSAGSAAVTTVAPSVGPILYLALARLDA